MNRHMRRSQGYRGPAGEEDKRVKVFIKGDIIVLQLIGETSKTVSNAYMSPRMSLRLGWGFIKSAWTAWTHEGIWTALKTAVVRKKSEA